ADRIVLSTGHQSKGLEWDVVFVMHLTDQGFPHPRAYEEENGIEEERRLFYVAVTRARRQLLLTYPLVAGYDKLTAMQPSQFLGEIDGDAVEHITVERGSRAALGGGMSDGADDAPDADADETIELDANGDRVPAKPKKRGYLSDVTEL
ncbi:MAG: 3'-5' exonuclease, partial [Patescibacteria group bacterium]